MKDIPTVFLKYEDVSDIFDAGRIWCGSYEKYWYQYAWSILIEQDLTCYSTEIERYKIMSYAFTLIDIYNEFCNVTFGEYHDDIYDTIMDFVPDVIIGQVAAEFLTDGEAFENADETVQAILPDLRCIVFNALRQKLSPSDVFVWMRCTTYNFTETECISSDDSEDDECEELDIECEINSIEDYAEKLDEEYYSVVNDCNFEDCAGFEFLSSWM